MVLVTGIAITESCKKEDNGVPYTYASQITVAAGSSLDAIPSNPNTIPDKYSIALMFSVDNGVTYTEYPKLKTGQTYKVKLYHQNWGVYLTTAGSYEFDWSQSVPQPTSGATGEAAEFTLAGSNTIKVSIRDKYCSYDPTAFTGTWKGDEAGTCCSGTDTNGITQDPNNPNKLIMDNYWGDGVDAYMILNPSTNYTDQTLTVPAQVTAEGATAWGSGTYDICREKFTFDAHYDWPSITSTNILSTAVTGTKTFVGTTAGVFYYNTSFGLRYWIQRNTGLTDTTVAALAASGSNVYAGTKSGVFYSANNGTSWTAVNTGLTDTNITSLVLSGTNLFAGTKTGGVFLSINNGTSWTPASAGLTNTNVVSLAASGSNIFAGTTGGAFYSPDNGTTWTPTLQGLSNTYVSLAASGSNVYAGTSAGVFYTSNNGTSWTAVNSGLANTSVLKIGATGTDVFVGTKAGVFYSHNTGTSWSDISSGLTNTTSIGSVLVTSSGTVLVGTKGTGGALFQSTDNGKTWTKLSAGQTYNWQYSFHK